MSCKMIAVLKDGRTIEIPANARLRPIRRKYIITQGTNTKGKVVPHRNEVETPIGVFLDQPLGEDNTFDILETQSEGFDLWVTDTKQVPRQGGGFDQKELRHYLLRDLCVVERMWDPEGDMHSMSMNTFSDIEHPGPGQGPPVPGQPGGGHVG